MSMAYVRLSESEAPRSNFTFVKKALSFLSVVSFSAFVGLYVFGDRHSGDSVLGWVSRSSERLISAIGEANTIVAGVAFGVVLLVAIAYFVRGK